MGKHTSAPRTQAAPRPARGISHRLLAGAACLLLPAFTAPLALAQTSDRPAISLVSASLHPDLSDAARATQAIDLETRERLSPDYPGTDDMVYRADMAAYVSTARDRFEDDTRDDTAWLAVAVDEIARGDLAAARATAERAASQLDGFDGYSPDYILAWVAALEGDADKALSAFSDAERDLPALAGQLGRVNLLEALDQREEALELLRALQPADLVPPEHDYDPAGIAYAIGEMLIGQQISLLVELDRMDEAVAAARMLLNTDPDNVGHQALIDHLESGDAREDFEEDGIPTPGERFATSFAMTAGVLNQQRMLAEALMGTRPQVATVESSLHSQLALLLDPDNTSLRETAIELLYQTGHFKGAAHLALLAPDDSDDRAHFEMSAARAAMELDEKELARTLLLAAVEGELEAEDKLTAGWTLQRLGENTRARAVLTEAAEELEEDRQKAVALAIRSSAEYWDGDYQDALESARAAYDFEPSDMFELQLASAEVKAGLVDEGIARFQIYLLKNPNDPDAMNALGYTIITETENLDRGYGILKRAHEGAPGDAAISDSLGWAYYLYGDLDEAERLVGLSMEQFKPFTNWEVSDHMGDIKWHKGDRAAARRFWQESLDENPPRKDAATIRDKLENGLQTPPPERRDPPDRDTSAPRERDRI